MSILLVVAFLRGINVGGKNLIKNEELSNEFSKLGFNNVAVIKQSGNVVFDAGIEDQDTVSKRIQTILHDRLGHDVGVFIRTIEQVKEIVKTNAFKNLENENASFLVTLLSIKPTNLEVPVRIPKSTADIILKTGKEVYSVTRGHGDGGKPNPYIEKKLKTKATTRNWNLLKEIAENY